MQLFYSPIYLKIKKLLIAWFRHKSYLWCFTDYNIYFFNFSWKRFFLRSKYILCHRRSQRRTFTLARKKWGRKSDIGKNLGNSSLYPVWLGNQHATNRNSSSTVQEFSKSDWSINMGSLRVHSEQRCHLNQLRCWNIHTWRVTGVWLHWQAPEVPLPFQLKSRECFWDKVNIRLHLMRFNSHHGAVSANIDWIPLRWN